MFKKGLSLLLALAMVLALGLSFGSAEAVDPSTLDPYEIVYYMYSTKPSDQVGVIEEALNAIIQPKFNATIKIVMIAGGDWNDKAIVPLRAGEKIDIFWTPEWMQYMSNIQNGSLLELDDPDGPYGSLIDLYAPQTKIDLGGFITANIVNGYLYAVPTQKELCVPGGLVWNQDLVEKYNIDYQSVDTIEELDAVLNDFAANAEEFAAGGFYPLLSVDGWSAFSPFIQGYMNDMNPITMYIGEPGATDGEPVLYWEQEATRNWVMQKKEWYDKKYVHPDSYLSSFLNTDYLNAGDFLVSFDFVLKGGQVKAKELMGQSGNPDLHLVELQNGPNFIYTTHAGGSMLGIPVTSEDPPRAMMYINEMHQNVELLNLMAWGIEGTHYDKVTEGGQDFASPKAKNGWSDSHGGMWTLGDQFKQMLALGEDPDKYKQMNELTAEGVNHESLGFRFDRTDYENEITAIGTLEDANLRSWVTGANIDNFEQIRAELDTAGLPKLFEAIKQQYADWKASK